MNFDIHSTPPSQDTINRERERLARDLKKRRFAGLSTDNVPKHIDFLFFVDIMYPYRTIPILLYIVTLLLAIQWKSPIFFLLILCLFIIYPICASPHIFNLKCAQKDLDPIDAEDARKIIDLCTDSTLLDSYRIQAGQTGRTLTKGELAMMEAWAAQEEEKRIRKKGEQVILQVMDTEPLAVNEFETVAEES